MLFNILMRPYGLAMLVSVFMFLARLVLSPLPMALNTFLLWIAPFALVAGYTVYLYKNHFSRKFKLFASLWNCLFAIINVGFSYLGIHFIQKITQTGQPAITNQFESPVNFFNNVSLTDASLYIGLFICIFVPIVIAYHYFVYWLGNVIGLSILEKQKEN